MLTVSENVKSALSSDSVRFAWLIDMPGQAVGSRMRFTDHATTITAGGESYLSNGMILGIPTLVRDGKIKSHSINVTFSGNSAELHQLLAFRNMTGEPVRLSIILLDTAGTPLPGSPLTLFVGSFDGWSYLEGGSSDTISVKVTGPWAKPQLTAGRITSDSDQQDRYPGDRFYAYAHIQRDNLGWGKE